ncbi:hypothetical protein [Bacteroides ovatus]|uniref:hypothetical protein n=1 Tax=Bacteroides ovatus TaxID=28116 RepID=UPI0032BFB92A
MSGFYCPKAVIPRHISKLNADASRHTSLTFAIGKPCLYRMACQIREQQESEKSASLPVYSHSERFYPFPLFVDEWVGNHAAILCHPLQQAWKCHN